MNVTIKIEDEVCRAARHRAVDRGLSLSGWISQLIQGEIEAGEDSAELGLLEGLAIEEGEEKAFEIPRSESPSREVSFS